MLSLFVKTYLIELFVKQWMDPFKYLDIIFGPPFTYIIVPGLEGKGMFLASGDDSGYMSPCV